MTCVVISQPMLFPWVGLFEQIRLADAFVHYDDVQFSKGSFTNRVQIKTVKGSRWLTVPLAELHLGQKIQDVLAGGRKDWRRGHLDLLAQAYREAPHCAEMLALVESAYAGRDDHLGEIAIASIERVCDYFELVPKSGFSRSSALDVDGDSWPRVLEIVKQLGGDLYVTAHGAKNYLDHEAFESEDVRVEYMRYEKRVYPQLHGEFTPFVSILDLIANRGRAGRDVICSGTVDWRQFDGGD